MRVSFDEQLIDSLQVVHNDLFQINEYLKPYIIQFLNEIEVLQLSCTSHYSLALTSDGYVYGWGSNSCGQTGVGKNLLTKIITIPTILKSLSNFKIKSIYCEVNKSFGITSDGLVYSWVGTITVNWDMT